MSRLKLSFFNIFCVIPCRLLISPELIIDEADVITELSHTIRGERETLFESATEPLPWLGVFKLKEKKTPKTDTDIKTKKRPTNNKPIRLLFVSHTLNRLRDDLSILLILIHFYFFFK